MKYSDRYIVELSRSAIFDEKPAPPCAKVNWEYIYDKSNEQNISGLLFPAIMKLDKKFLPSDELIRKWNNVMLVTMSVTSRRYNEFIRMCRIVNKNGIKMIGLKGCILRNIYPVPELRTMGDFDVLVDSKSMKDITKIFKDNGYEIINDAFGIICKNSIAYWEIFDTMEEEFRIRPDKYDELFLNNCISKNDATFPEYTYFFAHMIVHMGKHYIREGAGIRNLCDAALFIKKYKDNIDFNKAREICNEQNYSNIYSYIINTVNKWYGIDISGINNIEEKDCDLFMEYTLLNGIFGKQDNTIVSQVAKHEDDSIGGIRKILFPTVKMLDYRYKYLKKMPFLLPIAWIQRIFSAMFRWKYSLKTMAGDMKEAVEFSEERMKWLKELGLRDKH